MTFQERVDGYLSTIEIVGPWCCWRSTLRAKIKGYTCVRIFNRTYLLHRILYERLIRQIPRNLVSDHLCRHHWCVNPDHLEPVTTLVNNLRGYGASGRNARKRKCLRGHPLRKENLRPGYGHWRVCKTCHREAARKYRRQAREFIDGN